MSKFDDFMIESLGESANMDKTIQELKELTILLERYQVISMLNPGLIDKKEYLQLVEDIKEERVDVSVMLKRIDAILGFTSTELIKIKNFKIDRTKNRYKEE